MSGNDILMYPEFARSAKAFLASNTAEKYTTVTAMKNSRFSFEPDSLPYRFTLRELGMVAKSGRTVGDLEIRCDYLQQLKYMQADSEAYGKLIRLAVNSALNTPIRLTFETLRASVEEEMLVILENEKSLKALFADPMLSEYGLLNTVSIKLQNPLASILFTQSRVKQMGETIASGSAPITLFVPAAKAFFMRDNAMLPVRVATAEEQLAIATGKLAVRRNVQYTLGQYYDVGQLRLTEHERSRLISLHKPQGHPVGSYEQILQFAAQVQNAAGATLKVQEAAMQGMPVASLYNSEENIILINSQLPQDRKLTELVERLADATVVMTSPGSLKLQAFEKRLLSVQLCSKWDVEQGGAAFAELTSSFRKAVDSFGDETLEAVTARVNRAAQYLCNGVAEQSNSMKPEQEQQQENRQTLRQGQGEELENFLQGL